MWNLFNLQLWNEFESECDPLRFVGLNNYVFNFLFSNLFCCRTKWLLQLLTVPDFPDNLQIFRNISRPSICIHLWWYNNWTDIKQHAYYCICQHNKTHKTLLLIIIFPYCHLMVFLERWSLLSFLPVMFILLQIVIQKHVMYSTSTSSK